MAKKQPTAKQLAARKAAGARLKAMHASKSQNKNPHTQTESATGGGIDLPLPQAPAPQLITLTPEQLSELVNRLAGGQTTDKQPAPSMTPGVGLQTNALGQVVGTKQLYDPNPNLYPNPIERLYEDFDAGKRTKRIGLRDNYFLTWDISSKPYETKFGYSAVEPFFHMTLYANMFDDQGEDTGQAIVIQTLHFNEDEGIALDYAHEQGLELSEDNMREIMDETRYQRAKQWLIDIFWPVKSFAPSVDFHEEAIGGSVVKVVTKSSVKGFGNPTPKISDEELQ